MQIVLERWRFWATGGRLSLCSYNLATFILTTGRTSLMFNHTTATGRTDSSSRKDKTDIATAVTGAYRTHPLFWHCHSSAKISWLCKYYIRLEWQYQGLVYDKGD